MEKIYLNLKETNQCRRSGGHRTSNGWVNSYKIDVDYSLTSSTRNALLPLKTCSVFERIFAQYSGSHDYDNDRYGYIDEYCNVKNIDISTFINELNVGQRKYEFIQSSDSLEYDAWTLVINSRKEDSNTTQIINQCNAELERHIKILQEGNRKKILELTYPHIKNLIIEDQLDFLSKYENLDSYPLDLLATHHEYDLLITNILKYKNVPFEDFNEVYTLLTTGVISYFDILNGTVEKLNNNENLILSEFLREMEKRYRHDNYQSIISSFPLTPSRLEGLCNLFGHLLIEVGVNRCYEMIDWWKFSSLPENQRSVFSFHSRYLFPYYIIALLADDTNLTQDSFFDKYKYNSGFNDIPLIFDERGIYFKKLIPYFKKIIQNLEAINILSLILHTSNIEQYVRDQIRNREIISCKNNLEMCKVFVEKTLNKFISNESNMKG